MFVRLTCHSFSALNTPCFRCALFVLVLLHCGPHRRAHAQISAGGMPPSFFETTLPAPPTTELPAVDHAALLTQDLQVGTPAPLQFAELQATSLHLTNSGAWCTLADGRRLWRLRIVSPGAYSLHLLFDRWVLPKGARLFLYNDRRDQVLGAFTEFNNWRDGTNMTGPVRGDALTLEYVLPAEPELSGSPPSTGSAPASGELSISAVGHAYRNIFGYADALDAYGESGPCQVNINCPLAANFQDEKHGVALILSGGTRICTGTLLNNTRNDGTPYFLTANHCLDDNESNWLFMFNYESPGCTDQDGPTNQTVANATLRATYPLHPGTDFALLQLSSNVPESYLPFFCGWNRSTTATAGAYGISHPSGDIKKFARDIDTPLSTAWGGNPPGTHWQANFEDGGMEVGSSGSALFDSNGRIIGQLTGGGVACSNPDNVYYGKVDRSWDGGGSSDTRLRDWLDPDNTGATILNGIYPPHPQSDRCPARVIESLPFVESGSTALAANDFSGPCVGSAAPDVIYTYTPRCVTQITVRLCQSNYDTGLYVRYGGTCPGDIARACNDDGCGGGALTSLLTFTALADVPHYFIVDGDGSSSGLFTLSVEGTPCSPAIITASRSGNDVRIKWWEFGGFNNLTYKIYRADSYPVPVDSIHFIAATTQLNYYDLNAVRSGAPIRFYAVTASTP